MQTPVTSCICSACFSICSLYTLDRTLAGALKVMTMNVFARALLVDQTVRSARVKLLGVRHRLCGCHQRRLVPERLKSIRE